MSDWYWADGVQPPPPTPKPSILDAAVECTEPIVGHWLSIPSPAVNLPDGRGFRPPGDET